MSGLSGDGNRLGRSWKCCILLLLLLRSPAIPLGFTISGKMFAYVTIFVNQPLR